MPASYDGFMTLGIIGIFLFLGVFLRAKIKFLQNFLVPAAIIGGLIGFVLLNMNVVEVDSKQFLPFTLHAFNISFISLCLVMGGQRGNKNKGKEFMRGCLWLSLIWVASYALQGIAGALSIIFYNLVSGNSLSESYGFLVTHGFTQGPGQGMALGGMWESKFGLESGKELGLIYANIGFLLAFVVGVPMARFVIRKGLNQNKRASISGEFLKGVLDDPRKTPVGYETTHPSNIDSFALHIALIGVTYFLAQEWLIWGIANLKSIPYLGVFFHPGFFFLHGLGVATILRIIIKKVGASHLFDGGVQRHITSMAIDVMLVASFLSVQMSTLKAFLMPIILVCVSATLVTVIMIWFLGKMLTHLAPERSLAVFGCCLGATGNGLLLLRILDPDYSTSVSKEIALFNLCIVVLSFPMFTILSPIVPSLSVLTVMLWFAGAGALFLGCAYFLARQQITKN